MYTPGVPGYDKGLPLFMQNGRERAHIDSGPYRHEVRRVVDGGASTIALDAYLIDSDNPDTELLLDTRYPVGLDFGKEYDTDRKREIIFKMRPCLESNFGNYYIYWLALRATIEVVNRGTQAADLYASLRIMRLTDLSYKWATLPITWNNRETTWKTESDTVGAYDRIIADHYAGGGYTDYDEYTSYPTAIEPGQKYTYTEVATYEFNQTLNPITDEEQYWNGLYATGQSDNSLPALGFALKWSLSKRTYGVGWPYGDQTTDQNMDINCKFYGYKWSVSSEVYR